MKKLFITIAFALILIPFMAQAATVEWQHDGQNTVGYFIEWWETDNPPVLPNKPNSEIVMGNTARSLVIDDIYFKPNVSYTFVGTAWNATATSDPSNTATWTREIPLIDPPVANPPTEVHIYKPKTIILNMGD